MSSYMTLLLSNEPTDRVEAKRRRQGSKDGPRGRAEMPSRPTPSGGGGRPPQGGGGPGIPSGRKGLPIGLVILLLLALVVFTVFSCDDDAPSDTPGGQGTTPGFAAEGAGTPAQAFPAPELTSASTPAQTTPSSPTPRQTRLAAGAGASSRKAWTVMLYQDADDAILEQDIVMDTNEAERVGSGQDINIVAQLDRYAGAYRGDGDWTGTRRYYLTRDDDLFNLHSEMVADLGEVSMADPQSLVDFAIWAIDTYPADKYALIMSDHGMGWPGGLTDPQPGARRNVDNDFAQGVSHNMMFTNEVDQALEQIRQQTGIDRFELIGFDACLMSHLEVSSALAPHARFVVNSQETEPALGWAYTGFLQALADDPGMDGAGLGSHIVSSYIEDDQRIQDSLARQDYLRQGSLLGSLFGRPTDVDPARLAQQIERSVTLTAARTDALPDLMEGLNQLAYALQEENQSVVARARTYAQSFTSVFGQNVPPSYIDLGNFAQLLQQESANAAVRGAAQSVVELVGQAVVAEKHGRQKPGSTGISIYFPNSQLYQNNVGGARSYAQVADRFVNDSLWDDFLAFHYTGARFAQDAGTAAIPDSGTRVVAPGVGQIEVSPLQLSVSTADYDEPVAMQADLTGRNIGYVYLFVGYHDPGSESILVADKDYLESPETRQIGDLYYPAWSDDESFELSFTWTPSVFAISDGTQDVVALLQPERYGASAADAVYTTDGFYTDAASGETRYARMYFSDGQLKQVFGFTGMDPTGMMREVTPQAGDQITLIQIWLESDGSGGYRPVATRGETLTFGDQAFTWKELYAASGTYVLGFVVSDLDGNEKQTFGTVQIR